METSLFNRLQATVLAVATAGLILLAVLNLRQEARFEQPDDGVWWREVQGGLEAVKVLPNSTGQRAGIQQGDLLTAAEALPDNPAKHATIHTQDLLSAERPLSAKPNSGKSLSNESLSEAGQAGVGAEERVALPKNPVVHLS